MSPKTSHDIAGRKPRNDTERQTREATIADAGEMTERIGILCTAKAAPSISARRRKIYQRPTDPTP